MKIFTYGSLMRGEFNNLMLDCGENKFISKGITKREFELYDMGSFPGIVTGGSNAIVGEVWDICQITLTRLDILESHPDFYKRERIVLQGGEKVQTYILNKEHLDSFCKIIKSGDWKNR